MRCLNILPVPLCATRRVLGYLNNILVPNVESRYLSPDFQSDEYQHPFSIFAQLVKYEISTQTG
jgi:hypothetical protein